MIARRVYKQLKHKMCPFDLVVLHNMYFVWWRIKMMWGQCVWMFWQGASGLGFAIVEEVRDNQPGIYIRSITPGGVAAQVRRDATLERETKQRNLCALPVYSTKIIVLILLCFVY